MTYPKHGTKAAGRSTQVGQQTSERRVSANGHHRRLGAESTRVYEVLRQQILAGELEPGTKLSHRAVAESTQTSNGPVITALRRLAHDGLILYEHGHGATVMEFGDEQLDDLLIVRRALETEAARLAARRAGREDLDRLYGVVHHMEEIVRAHKWSDADSTDVALHIAIAQLARSPALTEALGRCHMLEVVRRRLLLSKGQRDYRKLAVNHCALVDAIASGDPDRAGRAMYDHLSRRLTRETTHG